MITPRIYKKKSMNFAWSLEFDLFRVRSVARAGVRVRLRVSVSLTLTLVICQTGFQATNPKPTSHTLLLCLQPAHIEKKYKLIFKI